MHSGVIGEDLSMFPPVAVWSGLLAIWGENKFSEIHTGEWVALTSICMEIKTLSSQGPLSLQPTMKEYSWDFNGGRIKAIP